jgi:hypothetical protein
VVLKVQIGDSEDWEFLLTRQTGSLDALARDHRKGNLEKSKDLEQWWRWGVES